MPATITAIAASAARPAPKRRGRPGARSRATALSPRVGSGAQARVRAGPPDQDELTRGSLRLSPDLCRAGGGDRDIPARPRPKPPDWPPPELPASRTARRPTNHQLAALALATIGLPVLITAALVTGSKDLFSSTPLALMAYILALLIAAANGVAARLEDDETGKRGDQRRW